MTPAALVLAIQPTVAITGCNGTARRTSSSPAARRRTTRRPRAAPSAPAVSPRRAAAFAVTPAHARRLDDRWSSSTRAGRRRRSPRHHLQLTGLGGRSTTNGARGPPLSLLRRPLPRPADQVGQRRGVWHVGRRHRPPDRVEQDEPERALGRPSCRAPSVRHPASKRQRRRGDRQAERRRSSRRAASASPAGSAPRRCDSPRRDHHAGGDRLAVQPVRRSRAPASIAWPKVCPKLSSARSPVSRSSAATISALIRQLSRDRLRERVGVAGEQAVEVATPARRRTPRRGSRRT